jgi:hypothetical protein
MAWMGFPEAIRISVGSPAENTKLLHAVANVLLRHNQSSPATVPSHSDAFSNRSI